MKFLKTDNAVLKNELLLVLIEYLKAYAQKEPHLIALIQEYLTKLDLSFLDETNRYFYELIAFTTTLQK